MRLSYSFKHDLWDSFIDKLNQKLILKLILCHFEIIIPNYSNNSTFMMGKKFTYTA